MASPDPLENAQRLPGGATFHRCALQVNPHHYGGTYRGKPTTGDAESFAKAVVDKAVELNISVLAITDHNNANGVPAFRAAAAGRGVHVFPGYELTSSEGIHVLCLYPEETDEESLGRYLGELRIHGTQPSTDISPLGFTNLIACVRRQGGLAIAAHVTNDNGLFEVLKGASLIQAWRSEDLLAIQIPGLIEDLPFNYRQIVENRNPDYRRENTPENRLALAVLNAKDIVEPDDLADPAATSLIKMSHVSIEGFRQAFLDPGSRIRLHQRGGDQDVNQHSELVAMAWETEGFLKDAAIHFNSNLNVLIGGRGAGKSTIIESIRAVLGLVPIGAEARKIHEEIVRHVLRSGTKISLLVRVRRPAERLYRIERTIPNPPVVRDERGEVSNLTPGHVLPRLEVYGQHELSELAKSREDRTRLLDRFLERDERLPQAKANLRQELEKTRLGLIDSRSELGTVEERLAALPALEERLQSFEEVGLEERLRERSLLVREERVLASIPERMAPFRDCLESLEREVPIDRTFLSAKALKELPGAPILSRAETVLADLERDLVRVVGELRQALLRADEGIAQVLSAWEARKHVVQREYEKILRELQRSRVDGEEFIGLRRQIEDLRLLRDRRGLLRRVENEHLTRRRSLLAEWVNLQAEEFRRFDGAARKINKRLQDRVRVTVQPAGHREPLFQLLRDSVGGRLSEAVDSLQRVSELSLPELAQACRDGGPALQRIYGISPAQAERIAAASSELAMHIEELELPATMDISLNTAPPDEPPRWQTLEELSTGQKATAVLLLLLLESDAPLIIDQPEDDLDNRFITDGVVPRMREEKQRRQFVFSTHNANIPVLGDAELIVGLSASGDAERGHARIDREKLGSIDSRPVRELVEEVLEGGKEAFEMRRRKYGF